MRGKEWERYTDFFQKAKGVQFKWNFDFKSVVARNKTKKANKV